MSHIGDTNQGITIGTATIAAGSDSVTINLTDRQLHPPDLYPRVQLTPIGINSNFNSYNISRSWTEEANWIITIGSSVTAGVDGETVNYIITSRIEPKHILDHTTPPE